MTALAPLLLSVAALGAPVSGLQSAPSPVVAAVTAADLCALDGETCGGVTATVGHGTASATPDEAPTYATPAEVDCRAVIASTTAATRAAEPLIAACSFPIVDFHYRVSRVPDSERPSGSLGPQRPRRGPNHVATTSGLPTEHGGLTTLSVSQPIAVFALGVLTPPNRTFVAHHASTSAPNRTLEPLDRPPRA